MKTSMVIARLALAACAWLFIAGDAQARFLQTDPVGYQDDVNLYTYVHSDPTNGVDPTGMACADPCPASALPKAEDEIGIAKAIGTAAVNHPGETLQIVGAGVSLIPTPQTKVGGEVIRDIGTGVRALDGEDSIVGSNPVPATPLGSASSGSGTQTNFVVTPGGTAHPVPEGAEGPTPVINPSGNQTGVQFTGGQGGANGQVSTMRIMNPTSPRGASPGYPRGYIKYENNRNQGVDPDTGKTVPNDQSHYPIE